MVKLATESYHSRSICRMFLRIVFNLDITVSYNSKSNGHLHVLPCLLCYL